jgi:hypothetical protein
MDEREPMNENDQPTSGPDRSLRDIRNSVLINLAALRPEAIGNPTQIVLQSVILTFSRGWISSPATANVPAYPAIFSEWHDECRPGVRKILFFNFLKSLAMSRARNARRENAFEGPG